jgi:hypothetical protein
MDRTKVFGFLKHWVGSDRGGDRIDTRVRDTIDRTLGLWIRLIGH